MTVSDGQQAKHQKILIVGHGLAAWMTAANLSRAVNQENFSIAVLSTDVSAQPAEPFDYADATLPFGEALLPSGTSEYAIIKRCSGSFSHGIAISGWAEPGSSYFHPFGSMGAPLGPLSFLQVALCLRNQEVATRLANYSLPALAAQAGRFVPTADNPQSVLATCLHGLHIKNSQLCDWMKSESVASGVERVPANFLKAEYQNDGNIGSVLTDSGQSIEADLFIDCSGRSSVLAGSAATDEWQDWSGWLPCDHLVAGVVNTQEAPPPYSHSKAFQAGWIQDIPLANKTILNGLFNAEACNGVTFNPTDMENELRAYAGNSDLQITFSEHLKFGRRSAPWQNNCITLGTAFGLIDPVAVSNLQLLGLGISRLSGLLPGQKNFAALRTEYNRQMNLLFDHARDFAAMHYKLNGRHGESFWDQARAMSLPDELNYKLQLYQSRGMIPLYDEEPLSDTSWVNLFDEHGINPRQYSTIADGFSRQTLQNHLQKIRAVMLEALKEMPAHGDFLAHIAKQT